MNNSRKKCPCGNGKKSTHCCTNKKPRSHTVTIKPGTFVDQLAINKETGEVKLYYKGERVTPESATTETTYPRQKGPKVLSKTDTLLTKIRAVPDASLCGHEKIFAVDTNTKYLGDLSMSLSVTGIVCGTVYESYLENMIRVDFGIVGAIEFWGKKTSHERIGWKEAIQGIQNNKSFPSLSKVGIIVDSYLDEISSINNRTLPILDGDYLPEKFHLMYANSDKNNDSIMNKMIATADKHATVVMDRIIKNRPIGNMMKSTNEHYEYIRYWKETP